MKEAIEEAHNEIKRADHLIYVSLKYTRTVDVIKSIIQRLINAYDFAILASLRLAKQQKIPIGPGQRSQIAMEAYSESAQFVENIEFYQQLRRINRAQFTRFQEYRRHVTMTAILEGGKTMDINIDIITEYFKKTKDFVEFVNGMTEKKIDPKTGEPK